MPGPCTSLKTLLYLPQTNQTLLSLHVARGYMLHAAGHFRRRKQLLDCRELHLPCRWVKSIASALMTGRSRLLRLAPLVNDFIALMSPWECQVTSSDASTLSAPARGPMCRC